MKANVEIKWNHNHQIWVATDHDRPGCAAVNTNKTKLRADIRQAQAEYDERHEKQL